MVVLVPSTYSLSTGNSVPISTVAQATRKIMLLNRKLASRLTTPSKWFSLTRWSRCLKKVNRHTASTITMYTTNHQPMLLEANACTELTSPARVSSVPSSVSRNVEKMSHTFQLFIMPRFSCIITECRNAVPVSHGISEALSTGSHPQYPPQPNSAYAQCIPRKTPTVKNIQVNIV